MAGKKQRIKIARMVMTTSNSTKVNAAFFRADTVMTRFSVRMDRSPQRHNQNRLPRLTPEL